MKGSFPFNTTWVRGRGRLGPKPLYKRSPNGDGAEALSRFYFGTTALSGSASGLIGFTGAAVANVAISGAASDTFGIAGTATGTVSTAAASVVAAGTFDFGGTATGTAGLPPIQIIRGDDAPDWRRPFYDRQIKEFEDALSEIVEADDPQGAAIDASEVFEAIETRSEAVRDASQAISEGLRHLRMQALRRKEVRDEIAKLREELALIAAWRRKRRNNEAALMLLM